MNPALGVAAALLLALASSDISAVPAIEGIVKPGDAAITIVRLDRQGVAWQREVKADLDAGFLRLRFSDISVSGEADFTVRMTDLGGGVMLEIPGKTFAARPERWTPYFPGRYALVQIVSNTTDGGTVALKLANIAVQRRGARILSVQDPVRPKDRPVWHYDANPNLLAAARSVAKVRFVRDDVLLSCTGFLVSESLLITNHHCFHTAEGCSGAVAHFGYEEDRQRDLLPGEEFACEELKDADAGLDLTLVKLAGAPGARWGFLQWDPQPATEGTALYVIQHPNGEPKRVALDGCLVKTAQAVGGLPGQTTDLGHTCDTENGSSGSPVLSLGNRVVGLHHLGFSLNDTRWVKENRAVHAARIQARIAPHIP